MIFLVLGFFGCVPLGTGGHASLVGHGKVGKGEAGIRGFAHDL